MKDKLGKRILYRHTNPKSRLFSSEVRSGVVKELSPSGLYFQIENSDRPIPLDDGAMMYEKEWFAVKSIEVLEVLD